MPVAALVFATILPLVTVFFLATAALSFLATAAVRLDTTVTGFPTLLTEAVFLAGLAVRRPGQSTAAILPAFQTSVEGAFADVEPLAFLFETLFLLATVADSLPLTTSAFLLVTMGFFFLLVADDGVFPPAQPSLYDVLVCGNIFRAVQNQWYLATRHQE